MSIPVSEKRRAANRRNAALSTGPKTEAGKMKSRVNAVKHGLSAIVVPVEDEATVRRREVGVFETIRPQTGFQAWLCTMIAILTIRLDRLRVLEREIRAGGRWRAEHLWDEDQRNQAERIAARLARDPARTVGELRRSVAGSDWLIERWALLADVADRQDWTDEQTALAHDLLGTPAVLRGNAPGHTVDTAGQRIATGESAADLAREMLAELNLHRERVVEADAIARTLAIADLDDFHNRDLIRCRRHERSLLNDLNRYYLMSQHESPHTAPASRLTGSIPAEFWGSPSSVQNEPITPTEPSVPTEPTVAVTVLVPNEPTAVVAVPVANEPTAAAADSVPNEPTAAVVVPVPNEPTIAALVFVPNEPTIAAAVLVQNEPTAPDAPAPKPEPILLKGCPPAPVSTGMSPALLALLNEDLPDPATLDPAWCRACIRSVLADDTLDRDDGPDSLMDLEPNRRNH